MDRAGGVPRVDDARRRARTARLLLRARAASGPAREHHENEVVRLNLAVALDVARRYRGRGISDDDLDQVASLGLVKAVRTFDPTLGHDFLAFAVPTVRGELRRHFRDSGWTVRPPRSVQEAQRRIVGAEAVLVQELGRQPRPDEIAAHLGLPERLVRDSLAATGCFTAEPLDPPRQGARHLSLGALDPAFDSAEARASLSPLLRALDDRERTIVGLRFLEHRSQTEIGAAVGLSQEQVSRILAGILARLRRAMDALPEERVGSAQAG